MKPERPASEPEHVSAVVARVMRELLGEPPEPVPEAQEAVAGIVRRQDGGL